MVNICILGEVRAVDADGAPIDLGPPKCRIVLAALALSAGSAVPVQRLVELVWGDEAPRTAEKTLQSYVTRLRKGLGGDAIARVGAAYRLDVGEDAVDVARFEARRAEGDVAGALKAWGGQPLAGLDAGGLAPVIDGLVESWIGVVELDVGLRVAGGDGATVIGELTELTSRHPFREGLWSLLMVSLYQAGRQADALAAFARCRSGLVEGLGVDPGPRLRELEAAILAQDDNAVAAALPSADDTSQANRSTTTATGGRGRTTSNPTGTVTFGFCDVVDGARFWAGDGPDMAAVVARLNTVLQDAAEANQGYVFSVAGDSVGVAFHRASDGLAWAAAVRDQLAAEAHPIGDDRGPLQVRTGLHTGETEGREGGYLGPAVTLASRLAMVGHGGQILISGTTAELLPEAELTDLGMFRLEGTVTDQRILQLGERRFPPLRSEGNRRGNLTRRSSRLIGRQDELAQIVSALETQPLVTLVGPGGIGKTSLAIAAAQLSEADYSGGVWLVALAGIGSSDDVVRAVADTLNVNDQAHRSMAEAVVSTLQARRILLVLDNCEHVVDGAAELADLITASCEHVRILATSREGLGVPNERLVSVAPLDQERAAVELFNERALAVNPGFRLEDHRSQVAEICARLDGVPLAIELAAARTTTLTPDDVVDRLDDRFRLLTGGRRTTMERHRTLRATIQWSYDLLNPGERTLFHQLSVFAGPFDLDAVLAVGRPSGEAGADGARDAFADDQSVDRLLGGLVDQSMVVAEPGTFGRRFRLLEAMRDFGAEYLHRSDDTDLVAERHADWCVAQVTEIRTLLSGKRESEGVTRLNELWPNLRAAFSWAHAVEDGGLARRLLEPIATEIYVRNRNEIGLWALRLLEIAPAQDRDLVEFAMVWAARRHMRNEDPDGFDAMIAAYGESSDPMIGYARAFINGDLGARVDIAREVVATLEAREDRYGADLFVVVGLGLSLLMSGRLDEVEQLLTPLLDRYRADGPPTCLNWSLIYLGMAAELQGREADALRLYDESAVVDLPPKTQTWNKALDARAAFRRGSRAEAYEIVGRHAEELLEAEDIHGARRIYGEFIDMMASSGNLAEASEVLRFLAETGQLQMEPLSKRFTRAVEAVQAYDLARAADPDGLLPSDHALAPDHQRQSDHRLPAGADDRAVLAFIRQSMERLVGDAQPAG